MKTLLVVGLWLLCLPFWEGVGALEAKDYQGAIHIFSQTIDKLPGPSYGNRCLAHLLLEEYPQAEQDCTKALQYLPRNGELWLDRGLAFYSQQNYDRAISDFTTGLELDPKNYRLFYDRALAYSAIGQSDHAIADYTQALSLDSTNQGEILTDRGIELMVTGSLRLSLQDFDRALTLTPQNPRTWFHRGCAYHRLALLDQAIGDFDRVLALQPHNPEAYKARGLVQKQRGNIQQALADLDRASVYFWEQGQYQEYEAIKTIKQQWLTKRYA